MGTTLRNKVRPGARGAHCGGKRPKKHSRTSNSKRNALYRKIVNEAKLILLNLNTRGEVVFLNNFASALFGFSSEELMGKNVLGTIVPEDEKSRKKIRHMLRNVGKHPERYESTEFLNIRKDGKPLWVLWSLTQLMDPDGSISGVLCIGTDITDRKQEEDVLKECCNNLENKLKEHIVQLRGANETLQQEISERKWAEDILRVSEEKYRLVVENANEAIVIVQDGFFKYFNPKTLRVLNYDTEVLTSRPVDDFIHPQDRLTAANRRFKMLMGESGPSVYSLRVVDGLGNIKWLEVNTVLITWMGRPATLSFINNITERKKAEEEVHAHQAQLRSLASELSLAEEKERRRLATDLHDHIGQTLAIIKIRMGALREQLGLSSLAQLDSIRGLLDQTISSTKSLTFQLSPPTLYDVGLEATLEWLGEQVQQEHGMEFIFYDDEKEKPVDWDVSVLMFQAVRELVMNVVKHSDASKLGISISGNNNLLQVVVEDDGKGFDPASIGNASFGLFSVRERLNRFGGTMETDSKRGRGTIIILTAPIRIPRMALGAGI
ncbi:MAG: PAS domain S-box protein [Nitrospirota bacterium]|jgi:PAS domain S-box-containing protein